MGAILFALFVMTFVLITYGILRLMQKVTGRRFLEDDPGWVIRGPVSEWENEVLYWGDNGWGSRDTATIFPANDFHLPLEARGWERA